MSFLKLSRCLFFLFFATFFITTNAQEKRTITLTCQDAQLTDENVNSVCRFGQPDDISNKEFTVELPKAGMVIFEGEFKNADQGLIEIVSVDFKSGVNIFKDKHVRNRGNGANDGKIRAVVKKGNVGDVLEYAVQFDAYDSDGEFIGRFTIDPKIRIIR